MDIDVKIVGPDGKIKAQGEQEGNGKYTFAADISGVYTYCFSNQKSTMTPKVVMFNMDIGEPPKPTEEHAEGQDGEGKPGDLDGMIKDLSTSLWAVKNEQEYMQVIFQKLFAISQNNLFTFFRSFFDFSFLIYVKIVKILFTGPRQESQSNKRKHKFPCRFVVYFRGVRFVRHDFGTGFLSQTFLRSSPSSLIFKYYFNFVYLSW